MTLLFPGGTQTAAPHMEQQKKNTDTSVTQDRDKQMTKATGQTYTTNHTKTKTSLPIEKDLTDRHDQRVSHLKIHK